MNMPLGQHIPKADPEGGDNWLVLQLLASMTAASS